MTCSFRTASQLLVTALAGIALTACSAISQSPTGAVEAAAPVVSTAPPAPAVDEIEYGSFSEDQLYKAIISELGAKRGHVESAGENYFDLALETRDLGIIQRAVQFASVSGDTNALLQLGML